MNHLFAKVSAALAAIVLGMAPQAAAVETGTAFTYQGRLDYEGNPVTGTCNFQFSLLDDQTVPPGTVIATDVITGATVNDGLFTVEVDFGDGACTGQGRWVQIAVWCSGDTGWTTLGQVQKLTPAPYALALPGLWTQENVTSPNIIGGCGGNTATAGVSGATIGGGGESTEANRVTDDYGTVGGGTGNQAGDDAGMTSDAPYATVGGGNANSAIGQSATVPGGSLNVAQGDYSFAAGHRAHANHTGSFVWADSGGLDFSSERAYQFRVRAHGGARFDDGSRWVNIRDDGANLITTSTGARLTVAGVWDNASDRALKENHQPVDRHDILRRLSKLPISTWNFKVEGEGVKHIGPVAQDFYASFGLGDSDQSISTLDAEGVALAAIQGLYEILNEKDAEIAALKARLAAVEQAVAPIAPQNGSTGGGR